MKKFIVLLGVLAIASTATAKLQISVGGDPEPIDSQIVLRPSEHLVLDIWTDADITPGVGEGYWALACDTAYGTISGGSSKYPEESGIMIYDDARTAGVPLPEGENGPWMGIALATISKVPMGATIFDLIDFHCEWGGDVLVTLYITDWSTVTAIDTVLIHQIPEPATVLLLGLGGLLLRRRK